MRYLLALLLALGASADASRFHVIKHALAAPAAPTGGIYDTSMGTAVDANGFTSLPLHAGAHRYFVKPDTGTNAETCTDATDPTKPLKDIATALQFCVTNANGDQVLLAEGATDTEQLPFFAANNGFSAQYPTVIESYDPADPLNESKYGRGEQRNARPILTTSPGQLDNPGAPPQYIAFKGIDFAPPNVTQNSLSLNGAINYVLAENCIFRFTAFSLDENGDNLAISGSHVILRNDSFYGGWNAVTGRSGGIYIAGVSNVTVEDSTFYHNAWKIGASRDDSISTGGLIEGGTNFHADGHPLYLQANTTSIVRRNFFADYSHDATVRGPTTVTENFFIHTPAGMGVGDGASNTDQPGGIDWYVGYNVSVGSIDGASISHDGNGWKSLNNGRPGSLFEHNLMIHSQVTGGTGAYGWAPDTTAAQPSYGEFEFNTNVDWHADGSSGLTYYNGGGFHPTWSFSTFDYNQWEDAPSGTNVASSGLTFPNAYTESSLLSAGGFASYTALINYVIAHPETHVQRTLLALAQAGYGITHPTDTTAPTLSSPTATATGTGTATIGVTTNEGNGNLFYAVIAAPSTGSSPTLNAPTGSTSGGTIFQSTRYYRLTAIKADGETLPSAEVTGTVASGTTGSISLSWSAVSGATDYKLYWGSAAGKQTRMFDLGNVTSYTDTGSAPNNVQPPGTMTPTQVKMGRGLDNLAAVKSNVASPLSVATTGAKSFSLTGITAGTYIALFTHEDASGNKSAVATSAPFTVS